MPFSTPKDRLPLFGSVARWWLPIFLLEARGVRYAAPILPPLPPAPQR